MKAVLVACLLLVSVALAAELYNNGAMEITEDPKSLFLDFMQTYDKQYKDNIEVASRFANFKATITRVNKLNKESRNAKFGITKFADMSTEEFQTTILMKNPIYPKESTETVEAADVEVPTFFDWRDKGAVTPVKDQESCGSCWAFSATEAVESAWILAGKATNATVNLAPQQIVDCDSTSDGCDGGETSSAFNYLINAGGQESNESYPYTGENGQCNFKKNEIVASITGFQAATHLFDETIMQSNLVAWGPLSVCVDASNWQDYSSGILTHDQCAFINMLDHCVQLVGYNATGDTPYWMVRNSWTHVWGVDGYIYLEMWHDTCGIAHEPTWPTVA